MAKFEELQPTDLLNQIREGVADPKDKIMVSNFVFWLQPEVEHLYSRFPGFERRFNGFGDEADTTEARRKMAEIVLTGLQIILEKQEDALSSFVSTGYMRFNNSQL